MGKTQKANERPEDLKNSELEDQKTSRPQTRRQKAGISEDKETIIRKEDYNT